MSEFRANLVATIKKSAKTGNLDANNAFRMALRAYDRDDAESLSFWAKEGAMCIPEMFEKAVNMKPITAENLAEFKKTEQCTHA